MIGIFLFRYWRFVVTKSFKTLHDELMTNQTSCESIVRDYLSTIDVKCKLNAMITVEDAESLIGKAQRIDSKVASGQAGPLAGMVVAVKDAIVVKNMRHTAGSRILSSYTSPYSATVIERLESSDAIIIGKANMDEFAMGSSNENSAYGPVLHPLDPTRVPGGSSGGSAVAVAAGMATTALGSETGGSVRLPASFCGVVGLKPTYGRVSRFGLTAFASSFDQIGPIANTVADVAIVTEHIAGHDPRDATTSMVPVDDYEKMIGHGVKGLRIGVPHEYFGDGMDPAVRDRMEEMVNKLSREGALVEDVSLPHTEYGVATYYILITAEASSNLARYDGVRYSHRSNRNETTRDVFVNSRSEGFGPEVKRRIMLGTYVLSAGYYDAYYRKAQQVRTLIKKDFTDVFSRGFDVLLAPTSPTVAFRLGEKLDDPLAMYLSDIYTVNTNIAGLPALSVPCGFDPQGLPIGIQVIGPEFGESICFRTGAAIETLSQ